MASDDALSVGWIGTGVMGSPMCGHLLAAGLPVKVFSRTKERALPLVEQGAQWCASPAEAAEGADVVVTMVGYPSDVRDVVLGAQGALTTARKGAALVDMTTSEPLLAKEIFAAAAAKGVGSLDAPVSGGDVGARNASLVIMVGGEQEAFDRALPVLQRLGKVVTHQGGPGAGQHTKMVNQIAIASGMVGVCEALLYALRAGLDVARVVETISTGAAGSWSLTNYSPRALRGDFEPGFKIDHFIKDLGIALEEARRMKLSLPGLALAEQLYIAASAQGRGQKGTHALVLALAQLSDVDWKTTAT
ncbi:MAG TPA: NAD(P)-dependent oxidoreductase [Acidimicrobiales bacterium]|nr:NAD(P)-dependent oxidoreductase [Acidimicrobiales bacterium]